MYLIFIIISPYLWVVTGTFLAFPGGSDGKESACNAGDPDLISVLGRSLEGNATHSSILAWRIPWTEEHAGLHGWSHKELDLTKQLTLMNFLIIFIYYKFFEDRDNILNTFLFPKVYSLVLFK